jgi:nucleotide-binding universal stress UspA family protein
MAYTHILVATDFSASGDHAVCCGFEEATLHHAKVTLLHVLHYQPDTRVFFWGGEPEQRTGLRDSLIAFPFGYDPETGARLPMSSAPGPHAVTRDFDEEALERLRELKPATFTGTCDVAVASGDPGRAIVHVAEEHGMDLIILGSHGRSGWLHTMLGGTADKVIRHAPCTVLVTKAPTQTENKAS